jgi:hypothetical protein
MISFERAHFAQSAANILEISGFLKSTFRGLSIPDPDHP